MGSGEVHPAMASKDRHRDGLVTVAVVREGTP